MKNVFIFDFDGVIADSLDTVISVYNRICYKYGLREVNDKSEFTDLFNGNFYDGLAEAGISPEVSLEFLQGMTKGIMDAMENIPLFPGMGEALKELSRDHRVVIITSNSSQPVEKFLENNKIKDVQEVVGVESGKSKVKKIEKIKNKYPDAQFYYIGDTTGDVYEGRKAGVATIAATWGFHGKDKMLSASPDIVADSPSELLEKIKP